MYIQTVHLPVVDGDHCRSLLSQRETSCQRRQWWWWPGKLT